MRTEGQENTQRARDKSSPGQRAPAHNDVKRKTPRPPTTARQEHEHPDPGPHTTERQEQQLNRGDRALKDVSRNRLQTPSKRTKRSAGK